MKAKNPQDFFANLIKTLHSAESQLEKVLPKLAKRANDEQLKKGIEGHLKTTEKQRERIEKIAEMLDFSPRGKKCIAMEGIINEMEADLNEIQVDEMIDSELIIASQKVEHYEIAAYGSACSFAKLMGNDKVLKLLQETLEEEKEQDKLLTRLAEEYINERALHGSDNGRN
jgi:ferritin-like metal-binding protein YciE